MLLAIDIGNTNITLGVFRFSSAGPLRMPIKIWRLVTDREETAESCAAKVTALFAGAMLETAKVRCVAVASVVPPLNDPVAQAVERCFGQKPFFVTSETAPFIPVRYDRPGDVGADRIANAAAAIALFGAPAIVIDFGTATTFDCISAKGEYLGGVIAPGPQISADALAARTARLPKVDIARPERAIGRSTVESIQSGLFYGYVGMISEILRRTLAEMQGSPRVIATGGLAGLIVPEIKEVREVSPELTLEGIRIVWERAQAAGPAADARAE